ncbi:MAG: peptidase [Phenylobacterium sp.]|nr:peptidase [Phenylobacterium sp.]
MSQGFDPVAATAAYLSALTPEQHLKAQHYTQGGHWLLLWSCLVGVVVAWIVLRTGVLVKVRDAIERKGPRPWLVVVAVVAVDAVYEHVLSLPWAAYSGWWREKQYGLTSQAFAGWLTERGIGLAVGIVTSILLFSLLYWVIRRAPKTWWAWSGGGVVLAYMTLVLIQPLVVEPLFNTYKPAPAGHMRDEIVAMAKQVGVPSNKILIYDGSKQSNRYTANVAGLLGTARVAMSDVMFKKDADLAEVRGVVGHEMGHYVRGHILIYATLYGVLALVGFFLADRLFPRVAALLGAKGVRGISDPAGLPVLGVIIAVLGLIATPLTSAVSRIGEADADHFSLQHFNEPDGLAKALVKTVEYRAATPSRLEEILFYDHPAVGSRVRRAMDWKAAHPKSGRVE